MKQSASEMFYLNVFTCPASGCWLWTGAIREDGYGQFCRKGFDRFAHRASWKIHKGEIPSGRFICHHCDVRSCVNPNHLFEGGPADNSADMARKGRSAKGEKQGAAKLTEGDVFRIRSSALPQYVLAAMFRVSRACIQDVLRRHTWQHLQ